MVILEFQHQNDSVELPRTPMEILAGGRMADLPMKAWSLVVAGLRFCWWHRMKLDEILPCQDHFAAIWGIFLNIWDASQVIWGDQDTLTPIKGWGLLKLFQFDTKRPPQNRWGKHRKPQSITISVGFSVFYRFFGVAVLKMILWHWVSGLFEKKRCSGDLMTCAWMRRYMPRDARRMDRCRMYFVRRRGGLNYVKQ